MQRIQTPLPETESSFQQSVQGLIPQLPLFQGVSSRILASVMSRCSAMLLPTNEILLRPGQYNDALFLVVEGRLRVHLISLEDEAVAQVGVGECVGEMSVIERGVASAFVVASEACRLAMFPQEVLWELIEASHEFSKNLLYMMSKRVRRGNDLIVEGIRERRKIEMVANVDPLTGLFNRRWLDQTLQHLFLLCQREDQPFSLVMLDVDHFKRYNDQHLHQSGDQALAAVGEALQETLRANDVAARYGGEEFTILLPQRELQTASMIAERLRVAVRNKEILDPNGEPLPKVTASLGVAQARPEDSPDDVLRRADRALYQAKEAGRDCVRGEK